MLEIRPIIEEGIDRKDLSRIKGRFLTVNQQRLQRALGALSTRQAMVLRLLPLLLHVNHPLLPGYISGQTPSGFDGYEPPEDVLQEAQGITRSFSYKPKRGYGEKGQLYSLFLMGSLGTIGYTPHSDMDFWLCHDSGLDPQQRQSLQRKCDQLHRWASSMGAKIHIFLIDPEQFVSGAKDSELSSEDCGTTQHYLLLDEFYRTGLWLAGRTPLWWYVPVYEEHRYPDYCAELLAKRFVRPEDVVDLGHMAVIPPSEFVGAGMWHIYKGIEEPYKSLLKLLLIELYAAEFPHNHCLSLQFKGYLYAGQQNPDVLDAYVMLYKRLSGYLKQRGESERLELMRRCFYLKTGVRLSRLGRREQTQWQTDLVRHLVGEWGWDQRFLTRLDGREEWKTKEVQVERRLLVSELMYSYRFLTQWAREQGSASAVNNRDLAVLGRRLYAAFERKADKVEHVNPKISFDLSEPQLTLVECPPEANSAEHWALYCGNLSRAEVEYHSPLKRLHGLLELLVWAYRNGVIDEGTGLTVLPLDSSLSETDLYRIFQTLRQHFPLPFPEVSEARILARAYPKQLLLFVNLGLEPMAALQQEGIQIATEHTNALDFSGRRENLVLSLDVLVLNSWNELLVHRFVGERALLDSLVHVLTEVRAVAELPQLKVYCFGRLRANSIAERVQNVVDEVTTLVAEQPNSGFVFQVKEQVHTLAWQDGQAQGQVFANASALEEQLSQSARAFVPWHLDRYALVGHALRQMLRVSRPARISVFYHVQGAHACVYVLDERNTLFKQWQPFYNEDMLLVPWQRFLAAQEFRQTTALSLEEQPGAPHLAVRYYRLLPDGSQQVLAMEVRQPKAQPISFYYSVQALLSSDGRVTLYCNGQEFSELEYGEQLYAEVAAAILAQRQQAERYPCYITDLDMSDHIAAAELHTTRVLQEKTALEARLNQALGVKNTHNAP